MIEKRVDDNGETYYVNTETGKYVCPYCLCDVENEETYWEDHDTCGND